MISPIYRGQVQLLLTVLPEVAKERSFALHGGTAINLFLRDMPRLSVDIDLTYLPVQGRVESLHNITAALLNIKKNVEMRFKEVDAELLEENSKLIVRRQNDSIKIEVNTIKRGCFAQPVVMPLCRKAQDEFGRFTEMQVVETGHLYGGKVCAALDRQHPRDLFDIHFMLQEEGFSDVIKKGFIFYLISANRPVAEILFPNLKNQKNVFNTQFEGMTEISFNYTDYEQTRSMLLKSIYQSLTKKDKEFLIKLEDGTPDWHHYNFKEYPAVQWKLLNIEKLKKENPEKHVVSVKKLEKELNRINNLIL